MTRNLQSRTSLAATDCPAPLRAAFYLRVSTGRQAEGEASIPSQRDLTTRHCLSNGWTVVDEYDRPHQFKLLAGLNIFLTRIGDFQGALDVALRAMLIAQAEKSLTSLVASEWMLGVSHHLVGNQEAAQRHCESGMVQAAALGKPAPRFFGYDHRVRALVALARALWLQGHSSQAVRTAQQAIDEAADQDEPVSVCISLIYGAPVFRWIGDLERSEYLVDRLVERGDIRWRLIEQ